MSMNSLSGPLPTDFGFPYLQVLSLFSNQITGYIPRSICKCEYLSILDLSNNLFEGGFPVCIVTDRISVLELSNNNFSGKFPSFVQNCTALQVLDLAGNKFYGRLPPWIGNLKSIRFLRLRHNMFSGNISIDVKTLKCLQYLDIAHNGISGSLPRKLLNLAAMRYKYEPVPSFCSYTEQEDIAALFCLQRGENSTMVQFIEFLKQI